MTHAQISANARRPYADKIMRDQATIAELRNALEAIVRITDGSQPKDYPGALMVARAALKLDAIAIARNVPAGKY